MCSPEQLAIGWGILAFITAGVLIWALVELIVLPLVWRWRRGP